MPRIMSRIIALLATSLAAIAMPSTAGASLPSGIWTNNEDVYFAEEEGREKAEWVALEVNDEGQWRRIDAFGEGTSEWSTGEIPGLTPRDGGGWQLGSSELRKARAMSCWVSARKFAGKPDGSADWTFANKLQIFDQGGRVRVDGEGIAPDVTIRVRNVTWAAGSRNKPSLVLYIHKANPVRAESYSWVSPDASLVGVNLRWVQASCSRTDS